MAEAQESVSTESAKTPVVLPKWNCRVDGTPANQQWTVGEIFTLECDGPSAEFLSDEISFVEEKQNPYRLKVLQVMEQTENKMVMQATTYVGATHRFEKTFIADQGKNVASVEPFALPVKSVIQSPQQKPYGPQGAVKLQYPAWLWVGLAVVVLAAAFYGFFSLRRRSQMGKVLEELKQHNTALGAFNQFNKDIRVLGRQYVFSDTKGWSEQKKQRYLESLDEVFRMYLLREFYVPALDWNSSLVLKTVSKQDRSRFVVYGNDLKNILKELDRAKVDVEKLQVHDCKQLTQMAKKVSQSIWKVRK